MFFSSTGGKEALKALAYFQGYDLVKSHSIFEIGKSLNVPENVINSGKKLDLYYISASYPDAFPFGTPYEYFTEAQASDALNQAEKILNYVRKFFDEK